jgi:hypothetical protein
MQTVGAALRRGGEDGLGVQVALRRGLSAERVGLVRQPDVQRVPIELGIHGDRSDADLATGANDADGDLAAVGDQDLLEHRSRMLVP